MTSKYTLVKCGLFSFLIATTIGFAAVNSSTLSMIPYLRAFTIVVSVVILLIYLHDLRVSYHVLLSCVFLLLMNWYGLFRGIENLAHVNYLPRLATSTLIVLTGAVYFGASQSEHAQLSVARYFILSCIAWVLFLIFTGGFEIGAIPRFNFEIYAKSGKAIIYSQGISKFFGLATIACIWVAFKSHSRQERMVVYLLSIMFFLLSFIGGGRGDFLALVTVIAVMLFSHNWRSMIAALIFSIVIYLFFVEYVPRLSDDFVAARRLAVVLNGSSFGLRDILITESLNVILNEPSCTIFGCGFVYFQQYYSYPYGIYPHNILLEAVITWGGPLVLIFIMLFTFGFLKCGRANFLSWMGFFFVIIGMKSGNVIDSWFLLSFFSFYSGVGLSMIFRRPRLRNTRKAHFE